MICSKFAGNWLKKCLKIGCHQNLQPVASRANIDQICRKLECYKVPRYACLGHLGEDEEDEDNDEQSRCTIHPPLPAEDELFDCFPSLSSPLK